MTETHSGRATMSTDQIFAFSFGINGVLFVALICLFIIWLNGKERSHEKRIDTLEAVTRQHSKLLAAQLEFNKHVSETLEIVKTWRVSRGQ